MWVQYRDTTFVWTASIKRLLFPPCSYASRGLTLFPQITDAILRMSYFELFYLNRNALCWALKTGFLLSHIQGHIHVLTACLGIQGWAVRPEDSVGVCGLVLGLLLAHPSRERGLHAGTDGTRRRWRIRHFRYVLQPRWRAGDRRHDGYVCEPGVDVGRNKSIYISQDGCRGGWIDVSTIRVSDHLK